MDQQKAPKIRRQAIRSWIGRVAFGAALCAFFYLYISQKLMHRGMVQPRSSQQIVREVSQELSLSGESPSWEIVRSPEVLQKQNSFVFRDVATGDYVLRYQHRLVIYRPSEDRIIGNFSYISP